MPSFFKEKQIRKTDAKLSSVSMLRKFLGMADAPSQPRDANEQAASEGD